MTEEERQKRLDMMCADVMEILFKYNPEIIEVAQVLTTLLVGDITQAHPGIRQDLINKIIDTLEDEENWGECVTLDQLRGRKN